MTKTNVMKILEQKKIKYEFFEYDPATTDGMLVAEALNENPHQVYKTLVTTDSANHYFVFVIPVCETLDLKGVAKIVGKKSIDMIKQKELEPLTGYIHGGCSPIGMKKKFTTYFDKTIKQYKEIYVSAGRVGVQVKINVSDLIKITEGRIGDLTKND
ncbi:MAG: Cys-tRNA(Pro) deacylase [Bacilli bacterium]|nr:Cys-tRNA(Pro) deacylase [Bacilli bacterium]